MSGSNAYMQMPGGGLILPESVAETRIREVTAAVLGLGGAHRTARPGNKNVTDWETSDGSADSDLIPDLSTLRSQSRDLNRNEALPAGALNTLTTLTIGEGIYPQAAFNAKYLKSRYGLTDEQIRETQEIADLIFYTWADSLNASSNRQLNFWDQQEVSFYSEHLNGDALALRRYKKRPGALLQLCVQLIEGDRIETPSDKRLDDKIRGGIEYNADGEPEYVHVLKKHPGERLANSFASGEFTRLPIYGSDGMLKTIHLANRKRIDQSRGEPWLAPVIELFKQMGRYTEAEIAAAVVSGIFAVLIKTQAPAGPTFPTGALPGAVAPNVPQGANVTRLQSGTMTELRPGEDIVTVNPGRPNPNFDPFILACFQYAGAALEIPHEVVTGHFTASYSAARAAMLKAWRGVMKKRTKHVRRFCQPVREWVLAEAVGLGMLEMPGFFDDPLARASWLGCEWTGSVMGQIDPLKEAKAAEIWDALGVVTKTKIAAEQFGTDFEATATRRKQEAAMLPPEPKPTTGQPSGRPADDEDDETED